MNNQGKMILSTAIFIVLNVVVFFGLLFFVSFAGDRGFVYEQKYAKQIALLIDNAKPEMVILLNVGDIVEIAEKNNMFLGDVISLDKDENLVKVSLGGSKRGYGYQYFSDYDVDLKLNGEMLSVIVKDKEVVG